MTSLINTFSAFDISEFLETKEDMREHLRLALEEGDTKIIQVVLGHIGKAYGMAELASDISVNQEFLDAELARDGNPSFKTVLSIIHALEGTSTLVKAQEETTELTA
ncbi:MAG: putative addiction module antidote protein [Actinomycetales bacterium]|nr:MAG: putative addiction module antidote protein [Actinomycetales bacterium]